MYIIYGTIVENDTLLYDIWKFNFTTSEWRFVLNLGDQAYEIASVYIAYALTGSIFYSLFGRNDINVFNSIYCIDFSDENPSVTIIANNQNVPTQRKNHCSFIINDVIFVFAGVSNSGIYLNDMWRFYLSNSTWIIDISTGDIPSGRELFGCLSFGNLINIYGGKGSGTIYNDQYYYDTTQNVWTHVTPISRIPSRYNLCFMPFYYYGIIIGGTNDLIIFDEIWIFDWQFENFSLGNANDTIKFKLIDFQCWLSIEDNTYYIYVIGGRNKNYKPDNNIYKIELIQGDYSVTTKTTIVVNSVIDIPSESAIIVDGDFVYVLFGSIRDEFMLSRILVFNYKNSNSYSLTVTPKRMLFGHSAIYYQDSIYIFGGGFSNGPIKISNSASNQVYKINTNQYDQAQLNCSPGTISPDCNPCQAGTYFNIANCVPCPAGTFSTTIASLTFKECLPCNYGYYSDEIGSTACKECPAYMYCPIGSTAPLKNQEKLLFSSVQPQTYSTQTNFISSLVSTLWYSIFVFYLFIIALLLTNKNLWNYIKKYDIFFNQHEQPLNEPVYYRKTEIGGIFTLFSAFGVSIIIIGSFLSFQLDNITEIKSLVPLVIIDTPIIAEKLTIIAVFYNYGAECNTTNSTCQISNIIYDSGFNSTSKSVKCQLLNANCMVNIEYTGISLGATSMIYIQMRETSAVATGISLSINSSSSIPSEFSSIFLSVYPDSNYEIFIGNNPTIINFDFTSSVIFI